MKTAVRLLIAFAITLTLVLNAHATEEWPPADGEETVIDWTYDDADWAPASPSVIIDGWPSTQQLADFASGTIGKLTFRVQFNANVYNQAATAGGIGPIPLGNCGDLDACKARLYNICANTCVYYPSFDDNTCVDYSFEGKARTNGTYSSCACRCKYKCNGVTSPGDRVSSWCWRGFKIDFPW